jgi:hypothetical protein
LAEAASPGSSEAGKLPIEIPANAAAYVAWLTRDPESTQADIDRYSRAMGSPRVAPRLTITPKMLAAGRRAFMRKQRQLNDLHDFYEADLTAFISAIYRAMASNAPGSSGRD